MADVFLKLTLDEQREVLQLAAARSGGRPAYLLEKDVWVVWALNALFDSALGEHLVFRGGTSLSKAYAVIGRFSEDVDLTYDIRALAPDMVGSEGEALPATPGEERRWSTQVRRRLPAWVAGTALPMIAARLAAEGLGATALADGERIFLDYKALTTGAAYVAPRVTLEFGARSTGEPNAPRGIVCDAAGLVESVAFPTATPRVMSAERTFWEKATAVHVFCAQGRTRGDRFSRHGHDLARLDDAGYADLAIGDRGLALAVARHKSMFFAEKSADGGQVDYLAAVSGDLHLTPEGPARAALAEDYRQMIEGGLLLEDAEPFETLMAHCRAIAERANAAATAS